ncbi:MAG: hypothetical protein H8E31_07805 [Planctomycetes bacterium]|nr:hypothetical protein [Planctomycetota bacterium]
MIEPTPPPPGASPAAALDPGAPTAEPVVLEDMIAVVRLPALFRKIDAVLERMLSSFSLPEDSSFRLASAKAGDGVHEYGLRWTDAEAHLVLFAGMSWGALGHDPLWEVRLQGGPEVGAAALRASGMLRMAARRAESRFSEWDRFWHEDQAEAGYLVGASAACTRFLEEENPDGTAAEYLSGALHALHRSGALQALREAAISGSDIN